MKILYCGLKYDYGQTELGYSFEHLNFYNTLKRMPSIKKLDYISLDETIHSNSKDYLNEKILNYTKKNGYDLIFFFLFKDEIYKSTLSIIKNELSTPTVAWMADDHWRFDTYSKYWAKYFSLIITTDHEAVNKYKKHQINNVFLSQWGCNHFDYKPNKTSKNYGVTFVGMAHGSRSKKIKFLNKTNEIICWGKGWENQKLPFNHMLQVYSNSNINLNFSESSNQKNFKSLVKVFLSKSTKGIYEANNIKSIYQNFLNLFQRSKNQIKGRVFEVPACNGFLLTENCPKIENYFEIDKEIAIFDTLDEANDKINYFKKNLELAKKIAYQGHIRVLNEHTYEKRFLEIFNKIL